MPIERIGGISDPRVSDYRNVRDPELVRVRGLFVAEGRLVVRRVLADSSFTCRSLLLNEAAFRDLEPSLRAAMTRVPVYVCHACDFEGITGYDVHRGCLALVERPPTRPAEIVINSGRLIVLLNGVGNPDNVGGVFRNALAFGAAGILLDRTCCDPLYRKAIRTSMATTLQVPFARFDDWPLLLDALRRNGVTTVALTPHFPSVSLGEFAAARWPKLALIIGAEGEGISPALTAAADYRVRIPMAAGIDSLNAGVAAGIALYRLSGEQ